MRFTTLNALSIGVGVLSLVANGAARATYQRLARTTSDVCADVDAHLEVDVLGIKVDVGALSKDFLHCGAWRILT